MVDRQNLDDVASHPIDDAVPLEPDLSDAALPNLGHDAPGQRKALQPFRSREEFAAELLGRLRSISGDEGADPRDVFNRLGGPPYSSQSFSRSRASSWDIVSPASAWRIPRLILYRR